MAKRHVNSVIYNISLFFIGDKADFLAIWQAKAAGSL